MRSVLLLLVSIWLCAAVAASESASSPVAATKALAVVSGTLHMPGLRAPVRVLRDRWGVAHIYAGNAHDLFFAQGVVAAQDRLFQMEVWKRAGKGRLSEILGPSALQRDVTARALQYRGDLQAEYASYSADGESILTAFTDGINTYIASLGTSSGPGLPIEFQLAGFAVQEPLVERIGQRVEVRWRVQQAKRVP